MHHPYPTITSKKVNLVEVRIRMLSACAQCFLKAGLPSRSAIVSGNTMALLSYSGQADGMRAERYAWKNVQPPPILGTSTSLGGCSIGGVAGHGTSSSQRTRAKRGSARIRPGPGDWERDGRPEYLRQQAITSRDQLGLQQIGLWQLHDCT